MSETNWKKGFCERYFDKGAWELEVLHEVDVLLNDRRGKALLYIETKEKIANETDRRKALAQTILTNRKQVEPLQQVALAYSDIDGLDTLELLDCSDNAVLYNNDINWEKERPSSPTRDAIDRICDRLHGRISVYRGEEIAELYSRLKKGQNVAIEITTRNFNMVYRGWKAAVHFKEKVEDEQDLINLFLVDMLNGAHYKKSVYHDIEDNTLFGKVKLGEHEEDGDQDLIREGTNLHQYRISYNENKEVDGIIYTSQPIVKSTFYTIADRAAYALFWRKYHRPPEKHQFLDILERSATLYSEKYRRTTGGEYTPSCFVEKQVELLNNHYWMDEFIVFDPCAGVGNLENQFGRDYKHYCYLSTLEQMDVDTCKIKGFENSIQYDYLKDKEHPKFKYKGQMLDIREIAHRESRKLMVVMNPPYQLRKGHRNNMAIEFFNKVLTLQPQVIVFYYATGSFFRNEIDNYIKSGYHIRSHIISNAKTTFHLSEWPISQIIFDREEGENICRESIAVDRYELERGTFTFKGHYVYNTASTNLFTELREAIKLKATGMVLGNVSYLNDVIKVGNGGNDRGQHCTTGNIHICLLSKGVIFNTHHHYFELNSIVHRGTIADIPNELVTDAIMFSQFYKGILFSNRGQRNYIMPFTAEELGCGKNDLNVLFPQDADLFSAVEWNIEPPFDFRVWFHQYEYSAEAKDLYNAALAMFKYYHESPDYAAGRDWNDSFYDITNAIMGKDTSQFAELDTDDDRRITRVKTTKGTRGFSRNNIKFAVPSDVLPVFEAFFNARDVLAQKINDQLVEAGLLLWKRENIY